MENTTLEQINQSSPSETEDIKIDYNNLPVSYCASCKSLAIRIADNFDYCGDCGGTKTNECNIQEWLELNK